MRPTFLVMGLPRSRTTWLAHLFTTHDTFCWHDLAGHAPSVDGMAEAINMPMEDVVAVGSSCSGQVMLLDKLLPRIPRCQFVYITRNLEDAAHSFSRVTGIPGDRSLETLSVVQARLEVAMREHPGLVVKFEDLDNEAWVRELWHHAVPDLEFPADHYDSLRDRNIQPDPATLKAAATDGRRCAIHEVS